MSMTSSNSQGFCGQCFLSESTLLNMWVMMVYIVQVKMQWSRYDKIAKQNVSWVSHGKALPARHSQKPVVTIYHDFSHSSHVLSTCFISREGYSRATRENFFGLQFTLSLHTLSLTHIPYKEIPHKMVHKIEYNYNQI